MVHHNNEEVILTKVIGEVIKKVAEVGVSGFKPTIVKLSETAEALTPQLMATNNGYINYIRPMVQQFNNLHESLRDADDYYANALQAAHSRGGGNNSPFHLYQPDDMLYDLNSQNIPNAITEFSKKALYNINHDVTIKLASIIKLKAAQSEVQEEDEDYV